MSEFGKVPPQSIDAEQAVLGGFLIENSHHDYIETLRPEFFYKTNHQEIFRVIQDLHHQNKNIDMITVGNELPDQIIYLSQITASIAGSLHLPEHLVIVIEKYVRREMIRQANVLLNDAYDESIDLEDIVTSLNTSVTALQSHLYRDYDAKSIYEISSECIEKAYERKRMAEQNLSHGILMPVGKLQSKIGGWQRSELVILAARPSMGKTAFSLKIAQKAAETGNSVLFISLEMSNHLLVDRLITGKSGVDSEKYRNGQISNSDLHHIEQSVNELAVLPITIVDTGSLTVDSIYTLIKKERPDMVVIDYIQLIDRPAGMRLENRNQEIGYTSRKLKKAAKDFNIPVIALSQLSRSLESRTNKRPQLSDLRESGDLEQDADVVMFLYRHGYYDENDTSRLMEIDIKKNRNGRTGYVRCIHNETLTDFYDIPEFTNDSTPY